MPKKMDEAEVKKECPSCGLGVVLDARICEFCGWDFEEEDEWILQIEKLERDLMLEKQKFEPGSVNQKIESTLHSPAIERIDVKKATAKVVGGAEPTSAAPAVAPSPIRKAKPSEVKPQTVTPREEVVEPLERKIRSVKEAPAKSVYQAVQETPSPKVRRVRSVKSAPPALAKPLQEESTKEQTKKVRVVRKVKQ